MDRIWSILCTYIVPEYSVYLHLSYIYISLCISYKYCNRRHNQAVNINIDINIESTNS